MLKFKPRTVDKYSSTIISPPVGIEHIARICVAPALATLSIQDYTLVRGRKEKTAFFFFPLFVKLKYYYTLHTICSTG